MFESTDGGDHWTPVALPTSAEMWRVAVTIAPSDVSVAYVWAAYAEGSDSGPHAVHRLYKRAQGKWTRQQEFDAIKLRAGHNWVLAVSPTQPNRVSVSGHACAEPSSLVPEDLTGRRGGPRGENFWGFESRT